MGPSKAQLMRQAQDKELLAENFDQYAKQLDKIFKNVTLTYHGADIWTGPAAGRYQDDEGRIDAQLRRLAEDCRTTSKNLRSAARGLRSDARALRD